MESHLYTLSPVKQFLKVRGSASEAAAQSLHIIAVIDTSGSMAIDGRLDNVKQSLHFMISMLSQADKVSLVTFDDYSQVHVKAQQMTLDGMHHVQQLLAKVSVGGSTNLSAGIVSAEECMANVQATKTGLLLLTDGYINRGIKETAPLVAMIARLRAANPTLTVYTTGYGVEHNAQLLTELATEGTGAYSIVHNQEHVASVFGDMLGGLMTCVAQNVQVYINSGATANTRFRVLRDVSGLQRVQVGDIYADAEQVLLLENASRVEVSYLTGDGMRHETVMVPEEASAAIQAEAAATELRLAAAQALATGRSYGEAKLRDLLAQIRALAEQPAWAAFVIAELEHLLAPPVLPTALPALFHTVSGIQQAAVLGLGRGLMATASAAVEDDPAAYAYCRSADPTMSPPLAPRVSLPPPPPLEATLSHCFSSPTQRQVTNTLRQISGARGPVPAPSALTDSDSD